MSLTPDVVSFKRTNRMNSNELAKEEITNLKAEVK